MASALDTPATYVRITDPKELARLEEKSKRIEREIEREMQEAKARDDRKPKDAA